jgi:hypothetical protein
LPEVQLPGCMFLFILQLGVQGGASVGGCSIFPKNLLMAQ